MSSDSRMRKRKLRGESFKNQDDGLEYETDFESRDQETIERRRKRAKKVMTCVERSLRQRDSVEHFIKAAQHRYSNDKSCLRRSSLSVVTFTWLPYHVSKSLLEQLSSEGVPTRIQKYFDNIGLPQCWDEFHLALKEKHPELSRRYFDEIRDLHYYPTPPRNTDNDIGSKQAHAHSTAIVANIEKAIPKLGTFLLTGLLDSEKRSFEKLKPPFTMCINIHLPTILYEDFRLELWVDGETGRRLSRYKEGPTMMLQQALGGHIYDSMKSSKIAKQELEGSMNEGAIKTNLDQGIMQGTKALEIVPADPDYRVVIFLGFENGKQLQKELFPD